MGQSNRIEALDGWRAISVSLVIVCHLASYSSLAPGGVVRQLLDPVGSLGVRIFFVLSGFVICRGLLESAQSGRVSIAGFYIRRGFRIIPPLLLYVGAVFFLASLGLIPAEARLIGYGLSFTCNLGVNCGGYLGAHLWSLSVEEQFYAAFPALFVVLAGFRRTGLTALALAIPAAALALLSLGHPFSGGVVSQFVCIGFGVGCALNEAAILALVRRRRWIAPLAAAALIPVGELVAVRHGLIPYTVGLPALISLALMGSIGKESFLRTPLSAPWLVAVGRVSYSIYLWQQLATFGYPGASWAFYAVSVVATFAVAFASYRWIERPLLKLGARLSRRLATPPAPAAAYALAGGSDSGERPM